jgi:hypothetical protein
MRTKVSINAIICSIVFCSLLSAQSSINVTDVKVTEGATKTIKSIVINEIGVNSADISVPDHIGQSYIEILSLVNNATPKEMLNLSLFIVGQDGQVIRINEGFINKKIPAGGTMVIYEDGTLEIRLKNGNIKKIRAVATWVDNAEIYDSGISGWMPFDPAIHDFAFGDTTADPLLVNLKKSGLSIDFFLANDPVVNAIPEVQASVFDGTWYPPAGTPAPEGDFESFDGSLTDDTVFARVFIDVIDSHIAADWTTNSTPTIIDGGLNPSQLFDADKNLPDPHPADGQTIIFGTESDDTIEGKEGPDFLYGRGGDDMILGGGGNDLVIGNSGDDILSGGPGDDLIVDVDTDFNIPGGSSLLDGNDGMDIFKFSTASDLAFLELTDLIEVAIRLLGIEKLDMRDGQAGDNLTISKEVVDNLGLNNAHTSSIIPDINTTGYSDVDIYVREDVGGTADNVDLQGSGWVQAPGSIQLGSEAFDVWTNSSDGSDAVIAIQQGGSVNPNTTIIGIAGTDKSQVLLTMPGHFSLEKNYPNPFNPTTTINYTLPQTTNVRIVIYDLMGREVKTLVSENKEAGYHSITWDATNDRGNRLSGGIYLYSIHAGSYHKTQKMVLLK